MPLSVWTMDNLWKDKICVFLQFKLTGSEWCWCVMQGKGCRAEPKTEGRRCGAQESQLWQRAECHHPGDMHPQTHSPNNQEILAGPEKDRRKNLDDTTFNMQIYKHSYAFYKIWSYLCIIWGRHVAAHSQSSSALTKGEIHVNNLILSVDGIKQIKVYSLLFRHKLTLCRADRLAQLSIKMELRTGQSILKLSAPSAPPPSCTHKRALTVAAAACSSPPPKEKVILSSITNLQSKRNQSWIFIKEKILFSYFVRNKVKAFLRIKYIYINFRSVYIYIFPVVLVLGFGQVWITCLS